MDPTLAPILAQLNATLAKMSHDSQVLITLNICLTLVGLSLGVVGHWYIIRTLLRERRAPEP